MTTYRVATGSSVQQAIDQCTQLDEVILEAGTHVGTIVLHDRGGVLKGDGAAQIASGSVDPAILGLGAKFWRIDSLEALPNVDGMYNVIRFEDAAEISMSRLRFNGRQRRVILGNGAKISLTDSDITAWSDDESCGFGAWDGPGPYRVANNRLSIAGIPILCGGSNSLSPDRMPHDVVIEDNLCTKELAWKGDPRIMVKNLLELKAAKRVTVRRNRFENCWNPQNSGQAGQDGFAILFTVRGNGSPWHVVEDVLFEQNEFVNVHGGFNLLGYDGYNPSGRTTGIRIRNNRGRIDRVLLKAGTEVGTVSITDNPELTYGAFAGMFYSGDKWLPGTPKAQPAEYAIEDLTWVNNAPSTFAPDRPDVIRTFFGDGVGYDAAAIKKYIRTFRETKPPEPEPDLRELVKALQLDVRQIAEGQARLEQRLATGLIVESNVRVR